MEVTSTLTLEANKRAPVGYRREARCLFFDECGKAFSLPENDLALSEHLLVAHRVLVDQPNLVSDMAEYLQYWRNKLSRGMPIQQFCSVVKADVVYKKQKQSKAKAGRTNQGNQS